MGSQWASYTGLPSGRLCAVCTSYLLFACYILVLEARFHAKLDTNLAMIKENTDGQPVGLLHRSPFCLPLCCLPFVGCLLLAFCCLPVVCLPQRPDFVLVWI